MTLLDGLLVMCGRIEAEAEATRRRLSVR